MGARSREALCLGEGFCLFLTDVETVLFARGTVDRLPSNKRKRRTNSRSSGKGGGLGRKRKGGSLLPHEKNRSQQLRSARGKLPEWRSSSVLCVQRGNKV